MQDKNPTFGGRLYSELRQKSGYDVITTIMDYQAIQQLKVADREQTQKLFQGSSYEVIQLLKNAEPEAVADFLVAKAEEAVQQGAAAVSAWMFVNISTF